MWNSSRRVALHATAALLIGGGIIGFAWMADWLPVEFGTPKTGDIADLEEVPELDWPAFTSDSGDSGSGSSPPGTSDAVEEDLFSQQTEPDPSGSGSRADGFIGRADWPQEPVGQPRGRANGPPDSTDDRRIAQLPQQFPERGAIQLAGRSSRDSSLVEGNSGIRQAGFEEDNPGAPESRQSGTQQRAVNPFLDENPRTLEQAQQFPAAVAVGEPRTNPSSEPLLDQSPDSGTRADGLANRAEQPDEDQTLKADPQTETTPTPADAAVDFEQIDAWLQAGEYVMAHKELSKIYWNQPEARRAVMKRLDENARRIYFSPQPHFLDPYVIQSGDFLQRVAPRYRISWQYLSKLNGANPRRIRAGQKLKVIRGPFSAWIDLSDFELTVHCHGFYVKRYAVGIGRDGATPIGRFKVLNKVMNPQYTDPDGRVMSGDDPNNPLGTHWIDLGDSYGIHGTIEPQSIGKAESRGCIRLRNEDVAEVYDFLITGSEVVIRP